ncbi:dolichyl-diphosphooligosaccharide--protein glycosyltransferase subunit 1 [Onygenales sp. PD_40]|nr:dolichyl-diphosphooligosaccharide--protein glycosyltransferase subunit 1 [Onygenales sp. PD_40]
MRLFSALCGLLAATSASAAAASNDTTYPSTRLVLPSNFSPPQVFKNTNLLRNINLEKGYVRETVNVVVENIDKGPQDRYFLPFPTETIGKIGGLEVRDKNEPAKGKFAVEATQLLPSSAYQFFIVHLPTPLPASSQTTLSISYYLLHSLTPLPAAIEQDAKQYLTYTFSPYAPSAYTTSNQKTKVKFPNTDIPEYTTTTDIKTGDGPDPERQGSTYTYGPYKSSPPSPSSPAVDPITVRYEFTKPLIACTLLERDIEVSHWGSNLATEERLWLRNDGASLSKHFSRVAWALKSYQNLPSSSMAEIKVPLKPGSVDPYFTDDIGNVSTSRFRPSPPNKKRDALLELRPRYPVFGGWKYSFRIGWNNALENFLRRVGAEGYVLRVPFLEGPKMPEGVQYERVELRVILPEGAKNVHYELVEGTGMPARDQVRDEVTLHKTFMDTVGRTVLGLSVENVVDECRDGWVVITYDYPSLEILRKPLTIAAGLFGVFVTVWGLGRLDVSIKKR